GEGKDDADVDDHGVVRGHHVRAAGEAEARREGGRHEGRLIMRISLSIVAVLMFAVTLGAQAPAPRPSTATPTAEQPPAPEPYTYERQGRRDPFVSLTGTGIEPHATLTGGKAEGPAGMTIAELAVRGVMQSRGTLVAMVSGPDHKTYIVHAGDKLLDGNIKSI